MPAWKRTFAAVYAANVAVTLGLQSFLPFFPSHLEELGLAGRGLVAVWTGAVYGAAPLAAALMAPVWGALADRWSHKGMVLRSVLAIAVFVGLMALAETPTQLLVLRLVQGVFSGAMAPSVALVSLGAPREHQGRIAGRMQTALAIGAIGGPLLGAAVGAAYGPRAVFATVALLALAAALLVAFLASDAPAAAGSDAGAAPRGGARRAAQRESNLGQWLHNKPVRAALLLSFWIQFAVSATAPQMELLVRPLCGEDAELGRTFTGLLFTCMALASLLAAPLWGRLGDERGHHRALTGSALAAGLALAAHAFAPSLAVLCAARVGLGATFASTTSCGYGAVASESTVDRRGAACGALFGARSLAIATAALLGGWLSTVTGLRGLFLLCAALVLAVAWLERPGRTASALPAPVPAER